MSSQYPTRLEDPPVPPYDAAEMAQGLYVGLATFLAPLLLALDERIDKRLVRTFLQTVRVILTFRDRVNGLLLSEMGGYLDTPDRAPAGTKRLSRLLHCVKWSAELIRQYLWERATRRLQAWKDAGVEALAIWDESVWEKEDEHRARRVWEGRVRAKPPDSRASKRATTPRRVAPFLCRGCIGWR